VHNEEEKQITTATDCCVVQLNMFSINNEWVDIPLAKLQQLVSSGPK